MGCLAGDARGEGRSMTPRPLAERIVAELARRGERIAVADTPLWHNRIDQKGRVS